MASPQMGVVVWETNFPGLKLLSRGKVRDLYEVGADLLLVATDRLSAFDVVLPTPIPDKGRVLTQLSLFWFETLRDVVPNHVLSGSEFPGAASAFQEQLAGRSMLCRKTQPVPIECVVRGYLAGSGMEGLSLDGQDLWRGLAAGTSRIRPAADSHFHAFHKGHHGPRRKYYL